MEFQIKYLETGQPWVDSTSGQTLDYLNNGDITSETSGLLIALRAVRSGDKVRFITKGKSSGRVRGTIKYLGKYDGVVEPFTVSILTSDISYYLEVQHPYNLIIGLVGTGGAKPYTWTVEPWNPQVPTVQTLADYLVVGSVLEATVPTPGEYQVRIKLTDLTGAYTEKILTLITTAS